MKWVVDYLYPKNFDNKSIPSLNGKVIVITGGCSGLGFEIATQCAANNAEMILIVSPASERLNAALHSLRNKLTNPTGK